MIVRFHGHACFEIEADDGTRLCIDPFEAGGFAGAIALPPLPDTFDAWIATHGHADHSAGHAIPSAHRLRAPCNFGPFTVESHTAWHDEFGGRLRGGAVDMLRVATDDAVLVHVGDLGERPVGAALRWLRERPIDLLVVPVGGWFTLGPDGAAELVDLVGPARVVPCHSSDDGVVLPQLGPVEPFLRRFPAAAPLAALSLPAGRPERTHAVRFALAT